MTPEPTFVDTADDMLAVETDAFDQNGEHRSTSADLIGGAGKSSDDNGSFGMLFLFIGAILAIGYFRSWWFPGIIAGLLFVLFMHEFGHYLTARASGMKVTEFFLGFGPKIWSFNRGETEYGVKAIPAGAYVRIMGMTNLDEIDPAEEHRTYRSQSYWKRMMTICAGSAMHFLMALVALVVLFASYGYQGFSGPPWVVGQVVGGSTADSVGIEPGDQILSINGQGFDNWDGFGDVVTALDPGPITVELERNGERSTVQGTLGPRAQDVILDGFGLIMIEEDARLGWEVSYVWPGDPADRFGLEAGDVMVAAGGVDRPSQFTLAAMLFERNGQDVTFDLIRDGESIQVTNAVELNSSPAFRGFFGVGPVLVDQPDPSASESIGLAFDDFATVSRTNVTGLAGAINPARWLGLTDDEVVERRATMILPSQGNQAPLPQPVDEDGNRPVSMIGIGRLFAESESVDQVLFLFVVVNIFIGIFNLVPLLPLDGGHAAIATYERIRGLATGTRHRVDAAKLIPVTWVVMLLLVGLGVWAAVLDIVSWPT